MAEKIELSDLQKEVIEDLNLAMQNLFRVFVRVDEVGLSISDSLECIGMEVPLFARPAVNQLNTRMSEMRKEVNTAA